jgi:hypothetical protein
LTEGWIVLWSDYIGHIWRFTSEDVLVHATRNQTH